MVGFGFWLNEPANLNLMYQAIFGGNQNFWINADGATTGHVDHIPVWHGVLFGLTMMV